MRIEWRGLSVLLALWACGGEDAGQPAENRVEESIVARVGDRDISVREFDRMGAKLLAGPYRKLREEEPETRGKLLDAMIGKELLLREAVARGIDRDSANVLALEELETSLLTRKLYDSQALRAVELPEGEIERLFHEGGYSEEVRFSHIMCPTREEAERALAEIERGAAFETVAQERSIHLKTARRQGDMGFVPLANMLPEVRDIVVGLEIGQICPRPVESRYGFHVFKLTDRRTVELGERREIVKEKLRAQKRAAQVAAYLEDLKAKYRLECDAAPLMKASAAGGERLCGWRGDSLTVAEYRRIVRRDGSAADSAEELEASLDAAATRQIAGTEARRLGLQRDESIASSLRHRREELLVDGLQREVAEDVSVTGEDVKRYFESHPERYGPRPTVLVQEILVADEETANGLRRRIEGGEDMVGLASRYHIREKTQAQGGRMWLKNRQNVILGPLAPLALDSPVGELHGPLKVPGGYSLFRVEEREQLPGRRLEEVRPSIVKLLELKAKTERMERLLEKLRVKYADDLEVFPEALAQTLKEVDRSDSEDEPVGWNSGPGASR